MAQVVLVKFMVNGGYLCLLKNVFPGFHISGVCSDIRSFNIILHRIWMLLTRFDRDVIWRFSTAWYGTVRFGTVHFWGVFHWVLYLVPDTFLVPLRSRFQASRTVTKTWRVNSADHWLAGENRHYCITELATRDPPLQPDPLDLNQHSQRRIGRNFCLNKRTFLHQPQNSSVVVCWGSSDVPLVDSRGADPVRAWWHDAEGKKKPYVYTFELAIFSEYVFCLYFYLCICVLLQLKTIWSNKCNVTLQTILNMYHCMST